MTRLEPGKPDGYLGAATVFWDYYLYNDALRIIRQARADVYKRRAKAERSLMARNTFNWAADRD